MNQLIIVLGQPSLVSAIEAIVAAEGTPIICRRVKSLQLCEIHRLQPKAIVAWTADHDELTKLQSQYPGYKMIGVGWSRFHQTDSPTNVIDTFIDEIRMVLD